MLDAQLLQFGTLFLQGLYYESVAICSRWYGYEDLVYALSLALVLGRMLADVRRCFATT